MKNIVLITGPAGCGLSSAEFVFEELGYYVVKNAPASTVKKIVTDLSTQGVDNIVFFSTARSAKSVLDAFKSAKKSNFKFIILNCDIDELLKRFSLTRHVQPRSVIESISPNEAIERDVNDTLELIPSANFYIDTTSLTVKQLRTRLYKYLSNVEETKLLSVTFMSFGLKNGVPQGIDCFFDVREIPNPYWVEELKYLSGEDEKVIAYIQSFPITQKVIDDIKAFLERRLKGQQNSGRANYIVGIACSGGRHRSTYVANVLAEYFSKMYRTQVIHRDEPEDNKDE